MVRLFVLAMTSTNWTVLYNTKGWNIFSKTVKIPKIDPQVSPNHFTIKNNLGVQVTIARSDQSDHLSVSDILNNTTTTTNLKVYCNCICLQNLTCHDPVCIQTNLVHYVLLLARTYSLTRSGAAQTLGCTGGCILTVVIKYLYCGMWRQTLNYF